MIYIFWTGVALIFAYEVWSAVNNTTGDTISEMIWKIAKHPIVPFAFGVLMGHLFW
jgi:hypothetical protein